MAAWLEKPVASVPKGIGIAADGCLHRQQRNDLQHVILHDIPDRSYLFIENSPAFDSEGLSHGDLHALYIVAVPDWLQERVGKSEVEEILDGFFAKVMIDSENRRLGKGTMQCLIERLRGRKVAAKRFFDDHARPFGRSPHWPGPGLRFKQVWRNGQVIKRPGRSAQCFSQIAKCVRRVVISVDILEFCRECREGARIDATVFLKALVCASPKPAKTLREISPLR